MKHDSPELVHHEHHIQRSVWKQQTSHKRKEIMKDKVNFTVDSSMAISYLEISMHKDSGKYCI